MSPKPPDVAVRNVLDAAFDSTGDLERTAGELVATAINRETLEAAHIALVQQMHTGPSDDIEATAALRRILAALASMPRRYAHPPVWTGGR